MKKPLLGSVYANLLDVDSEHLHKTVRDMHKTLRTVLRWRYGHLPRGSALDLPLHAEGSAQEVDVGKLHGGGLAKPQPGESAHGNEGPEPIVSGLQKLPDIGGGGYDHCVLRLAPTGQGDPLSRVCGKAPVVAGTVKHGAHVVQSGFDRSGRQAVLTHLLDPCLHMGTLQVAELDVGKSAGTNCKAHGFGSPGRPYLAFRPALEEAGERNGSSLWINVCAGDDSCGYFVKPLLGVDLSGEMPGVFFAYRVPVACPPLPVVTLLD